MNHNLAKVGGAKGEHPVMWHSLAGTYNRQRNDGSASLVGHFERTILECTDSTRLGSSSLWIRTEMNSVLEPLHSGLEGHELGSAVRSIHHDVASYSNGFSEDGDLPKLGFGNQLVVPPSSCVPEEGDVHP